MCNFEVEQYERVFNSLFFCQFKDDCSQNPSLDSRTRLSITVEGDNHLRKIYRGGQLETFEEILIRDYHVVNEVVLDRGPSPYCV